MTDEYHFSQSELNYIERYELDINSFYDASGLTRSQYQTLMKIAGAEIAYGVTPCKAYGHRLRTRAGHCAVCNPRNLRFLQRHHENGFVYIVESVSQGLVKVGITQELNERLKCMNSVRYAGACDWNIIGHVYCEMDAGLLEVKMHQSLSDYAAIPEWYFDGQEIRTPREVFSVDVEIAVKRLKLLCESYGNYHGE